ncbi:hypothetical protein DFH08DRAFT_122105, partial [Mycena albidolilacea]
LERLERLGDDESAGGERERESDVPLVPLLRLVRSSAPHPPRPRGPHRPQTPSRHPRHRPRPPPRPPHPPPRRLPDHRIVRVVVLPGRRPPRIRIRAPCPLRNALALTPRAPTAFVKAPLGLRCTAASPSSRPPPPPPPVTTSASRRPSPRTPSGARTPTAPATATRASSATCSPASAAPWAGPCASSCPPPPPLLARLPSYSHHSPAAYSSARAAPRAPCASTPSRPPCPVSDSEHARRGVRRGKGKAGAETDGAREKSEDRDEVEEWADPG